MKENGSVVNGKVISTCCNSTLSSARGDGVSYGFCAKCGDAVVRINPRTGVEEYLDGDSIWSGLDDLRKVVR
jgi:exosome complex RNA-binding protein Csl4